MQVLALIPTNVIAAHQTSVLPWIIDSAPFVLGLVASIAGSQQGALIQLNRRYEEESERVEFLEKLSEENPNPVLRIDHRGQVFYGNRAGQELLTEMENPEELPEGLKPAEGIFDKYQDLKSRQSSVTKRVP